MSIQKLPNTSIIYARNRPISRRFSSFLVAFARISGKSNGKFGQKQWQTGAQLGMGNSGKAMGEFGQSNEKTRRAAAYIIIIAFFCFSTNFP